METQLHFNSSNCANNLKPDKSSSMLNKVLSIDDDPTDLFINTTMIKSIWPETQVQTASSVDNAQKVLDRFEVSGEAPDLVLLDINMPVKNGWDFLEAYEGEYRPKFPNLFIVMLTSSENEQDLQMAQSNPNIDMYIIKPLTHESLLNISKRYHDHKNDR